MTARHRTRSRQVPLFPVLALLALVALAATLLPPAAPAAAESCDGAAFPGESDLSPDDRAVLAAVRDLPLELRAGQLLMPGFVGTDPDPGLLERAAAGRLGGLFLLQRNVTSLEQVQRLNGALSTAVAESTGGIRPFLATDFEGGSVNTLRAFTGNTPSAAQLALRGVNGVQAQGADDAATLRYAGFTTDLAPVADVISVPKAFIGSRAFSNDPAATAALSRAYLRGLRAGGVLGVMKHFPGHGGTEQDSHVTLPVLARSVQDLDALDLVPYRQAIAAGELQAVMVGHLSVPALDPELPTSLSRAAVEGLLRRGLGFDGLVMTDELKMAAISARFGVADAALTTLEAGVDLVLGDYTGAEQAAVLRAIVTACGTGALSPGRIDQSAMRVMRLKLAYGLAGDAFTARYQEHLADADAAPAPRLPLPPLRPRALNTPSPTPTPTPEPTYGGAVPAWLPPDVKGRWFDAASGVPGYGFAITDGAGIPFWSGYIERGGADALGYPITGRFELDGVVTQLTERTALQWDASTANVVEASDLHDALLAGIPGGSVPEDALTPVTIDGEPYVPPEPTPTDTPEPSATPTYAATPAATATATPAATSVSAQPTPTGASYQPTPTPVSAQPTPTPAAASAAPAT